jgi:hypothetical protein
LKTKLIADRSSSIRNSRWLLLQNDDGTLHVEQVAEYRHGGRQRRVVPINDFMQENGPPPRELQKLIDRMFDDP